MGTFIVDKQKCGMKPEYGTKSLIIEVSIKALNKDKLFQVECIENASPKSCWTLGKSTVERGQGRSTIHVAY